MPLWSNDYSFACLCFGLIDDTVIVLEPVNDVIGATVPSLRPPPEKRTKLTHHEIIELEKERCLLDIENAKLFKEVLLLKKEVLTLQKQKLEMSQPPEASLGALLNEMM